MRMLEGQGSSEISSSLSSPERGGLSTTLQYFGIHFWILNAVILFLNLGTAWLMLKREGKSCRICLILPPLIYLAFGTRWLGLEGSTDGSASCRAIGCLFSDPFTKGSTNCTGRPFTWDRRQFHADNWRCCVCRHRWFLAVEKWKERSGMRGVAILLIQLSIPFLLVSLGAIAVFAWMAGFTAYWDQTVVFLAENASGDIWNNRSCLPGSAQ